MSKDANHDEGVYVLRNLNTSAWDSINNWQRPDSTCYSGSDITRAERKKRTAEKKRIRRQRRKNK